MLGTSQLRTRPTAQRGFTAVELMVVVSIIAILTAMAAPSFRPLIERWRVRSATNALESTLYFARSEAYKRGGNIVISRNAVDGNCTSTGNTDWKCGWVVYHDVNRNGNRDACVTPGTGECPIQQIDAYTNVDLFVPGSNGMFTVDRYGVISSNGLVAALSVQVVPKGKTLTDTGALQLCIVGAGRFGRVKGSESC